jgi:hypothetical protein
MFSAGSDFILANPHTVNTKLNKQLFQSTGSCHSIQVILFDKGQ